MVYKWKEAAQIKADAQAAAAVLNDLERKGELNARSVVEVSRPEDAVLHSDFEWNDEKAAVEYRLNQARKIMQSLIVIPEVENSEQQEPVRAFFKIDVGSPTYQSIQSIMRTPSQKDMLLKMALKELQAFQQKYKRLEELADVFESIETALILYK